MHLIDRYEGNEEVKIVAGCFLGVKFSDDEIAQADRMEVWGSSFKDPGPDFCEYRLVKDGETFAKQRTEAY